MLECGMLKRDRQTLRKCSSVLCKQLVVDEVLIQSLQADDILTESMAENIMAEQTSQKRSWRLLLLLPKRGPRAFSSFCTALHETDQQHLCDLLTQSSEKDGRETHVEIPLLDRQKKSEMSNTAPSPVQCSDSCLCSESSFRGLVPVREEDRNKERQGTKRRGRDKQTNDSSTAKRARTHESMEFSLDADSPINTPVLPCTPDFYLSHCQQSYRMNSSPRGFALVISNVAFDTCTAVDLDPRKGGEVDDEVLRKVFTELDFMVTVHRDLTAQGMRSCIENFCRRPDHQTVDSCVVCLLSHGVEGAVYGTDGQLLPLDWVFEAFDNAHCPLLQNKPKMFFIQACRGASVRPSASIRISATSGDHLREREQKDAPIFLATDRLWPDYNADDTPDKSSEPSGESIITVTVFPPSTTKPTTDEMDCGVEQIDGPARTCSPGCEQRDAGREEQGGADSRQRGVMGRPRIKLPQRSDMICGFASLKGTAAMRNTKRGSWFIQELNTALRLHARDTHLADILVQVNGRIKEREGYAPGTSHHRCKEMSEFTSSLCKDLYLFPKYQPQY